MFTICTIDYVVGAVTNALFTPIDLINESMKEDDIGVIAYAIEFQESYSGFWEGN